MPPKVRCTTPSTKDLNPELLWCLRGDLLTWTEGERNSLRLHWNLKFSPRHLVKHAPDNLVLTSPHTNERKQYFTLPLKPCTLATGAKARPAHAGPGQPMPYPPRAAHQGSPAQGGSLQLHAASCGATVIVRGCKNRPLVWLPMAVICSVGLSTIRTPRAQEDFAMRAACLCS